VTARGAALTSPGHAVGPGATLRCCRIVTVPVRLARPGHPVLHLPAHRPWAAHWTRLCQAVFDLGPAPAGISLIPSNRLPRPTRNGTRHVEARDRPAVAARIG